MKPTIKVYQTTDESGAAYRENAPIVSRHRSLKQAVKSAGKRHLILRVFDEAEFIVTSKNTQGSGTGYWADSISKEWESF